MKQSTQVDPPPAVAPPAGAPPLRAEEEVSANVHKELSELVRWCTEEEKAALMRENENIVVARGEGDVVLDAYMREIEGVHDNRITASTTGRLMNGEIMPQIHRFNHNGIHN